jgi:ribose-phosphate pyrophosphokinase
MSFRKPAALGLIACPGGEHFTDEVIEQLKGLHKKKFDRKIGKLVKKYEVTREEVVKRLNFAIDLHLPEVNTRWDPAQVRIPPFKIDVRFTRFANGEFKTEILSSVRGMDIYIVQDVENHSPLTFYNNPETYSLSVNDHVLTLFVTIDAVLQAGAQSVTVVLPTYPFARQHVKKSREALTASWFSRVLEYSGVTRIITLDIHSREIENSFKRLRLENLHASYQVLIKLSSLMDLANTDLVVVSPDVGAISRNKYYAGNLKRPLALLYKERDYSKVSNSADSSNITKMRLLGSVENKAVFMADDIIGTGGTIIKALKLLKEMGAKDIVISVSLPLFSADAVERFDEAYREGLFYRIIGTNAVYCPEELSGKEWYVSANISNLFARTIYRLHNHKSLSALLDNSSMIQRMLHD